jgi:hypothetical protein
MTNGLLNAIGPCQVNSCGVAQAIQAGKKQDVFSSLFHPKFHFLPIENKGLKLKPDSDRECK